MNKLQKSKWLAIIYGALLVMVGALTLAFAIVNTDVVDKVISISLAVGLFIIGLLNIGSSLIAHTDEFFTVSLLLGSLAIAFGVVLLVDVYLIGSFIVYLLATLLIALGAVCLVKGTLFIIFKQKLIWVIIHFVFATAAITLGVLVLCFRNESKMILYAFIGTAIILAGLVEIVFAVRNFIYSKKENQQNEEEKIEQEVSQEEENQVEEEQQEESGEEAKEQ